MKWIIYILNNNHNKLKISKKNQTKTPNPNQKIHKAATE